MRLHYRHFALSPDARKFLFLASCLTLYFVHFAMTIAYLLPVTPAKLEYEALVSPIVSSYAEQAWTLFAPDPLNRNITLLVKCFPADKPLPPDGHMLDSPDGWSDITAPLIRAHRRNRFSPYDRLARTQTNASMTFFGGYSQLADWQKACQKGDEDACHFVDEARRTYSKDGAAILRRVASSFCDETLPEPPSAIAIRARFRAVKPWSRRDDHEVEPDVDLDIDTFTPDERVAQTGIYQNKKESQ